MIVYGIILLVVLPAHYLLYRIFKKRTKLSKRCNMNLTGILSIFLWAIGTFIVEVLPKSLRGSYASMWGDITIFPMMIIAIQSLAFMCVYVLVINIILLCKKGSQAPMGNLYR